MLAGRQVEIHTERDRKVEATRQQRQSRRQQAEWREKGPAAAVSGSREDAGFRIAEDSRTSKNGTSSSCKGKETQKTLGLSCFSKFLFLLRQRSPLES